MSKGKKKRADKKKRGHLTLKGLQQLAQRRRNRGKQHPANKLVVGMRNNRRRRYRRSRRRAQVRATRLQVRRSVDFDATWGTDHRWYYPVKLNILNAAFKNTFDEFKVISITVRYLPNDAQNETGLLVFVLLDREGFGSYGSATGKSWFTTLAAMPRAKVGPRYRPAVQRWRPSEPSARDWFRHTDNPTLCTAYVCNNGKETDVLGGNFQISATLLARGLYYNATVTHALSLLNQRDGAVQSGSGVEEHILTSFEHIEMEHSSQTSTDYRM